MFALVLILLIVWLGLAVFLWVGTLWFQGYIYSQPTEGISWRAPAASTVLTGFLAIWCLLDYRATPPSANELPYDTLFRFVPTETYPARPFPRYWSVKKGKETLYERRQVGQRGAQYVDPKTNRPWVRESEGVVEAVVIEENGTKVRFKAELTAQGKFKPDVSARYIEEGGRRRVLTEDDLRVGQFTQFRTGLFVVNVLLNVLHLVLWFVCLWLILRFQWSHALGLAVVFWLVMTLTLLQAVLNSTLEAVKHKPAPAAERFPRSGTSPRV